MKNLEKCEKSWKPNEILENQFLVDSWSTPDSREQCSKLEKSVFMILGPPEIEKTAPLPPTYAIPEAGWGLQDGSLKSWERH